MLTLDDISPPPHEEVFQSNVGGVLLIKSLFKMYNIGLLLLGNSDRTNPGGRSVLSSWPPLTGAILLRRNGLIGINRRLLEQRRL